MRSARKLFSIFSTKTKSKFVFLFLGETLSSFFNVLSIALLLPFIELLIDENAMDSYLFLDKLMIHFGVQTHIQKIYGMGFALIFAFIFKSGLMVLLNMYRIRVTNTVMVKLSGDILQEYMSQPYVVQVQRNSSFLLRVLSLENNRIIDAVNMIFLVVEGALTALMIGIYMLFITPVTTVILIGMLALLSLGWIKIVSMRIKECNKRVLYFQEKAIRAINQAVGAVKEIKILKCESFFVQKYIKSESDKIVHVKKSQILTNIPKLCLESFCMVMLIVIIFAEIGIGIPMEQIVVQMSALALSAVKMLPLISQMNTAVNVYISYIPSIEVIYNLVCRKVLKGNAETEKREKEILDMRQSINLQNISYHYPGAEKEVLLGINLCIEAKSSIGFIGESGAGKTTLVDILLGVLQPTKGQIMCGDQNVQENSIEWAKHIGYIPQTIYLLDESIRNNVAFGMPETEIDDNKVWEALRWAQLDQFVENLPEGLATEIGERGARLSGGQRQRIGIARALYHEPELLVLDEATSALDNETEKAVMDAIESAIGNITLIIVAHRLSTLKNCDHIYEIKDGRLLERDDVGGK